MTSTLTHRPTGNRLSSPSRQMGIALGGLTAVLGILVLIDPGRSLVLVAMLAGAELLVAGVYHLIPAAAENPSARKRSRAAARIWRRVSAVFSGLGPRVRRAGP